MGESAMQINETKTIETDILIIGGGTAGCYAALTIAEQSDYSVVIAEKSNIKRSGFVASADKDSTVLKDGDSVEFLYFMGGGSYGVN